MDFYLSRKRHWKMTVESVDSVTWRWTRDLGDGPWTVPVENGSEGRASVAAPRVPRLWLHTTSKDRTINNIPWIFIISCCFPSVTIAPFHYLLNFRDFFMVALRNRADHYIFALWFLSFFFLLSFFLSSPNLSRRRLDVCHTSTHGVALVRI